MIKIIAGLKCCPVCGNEAGLVTGNSAEESTPYYHVECAICHLRSIDSAHKGHAISMWNNRPVEEVPHIPVRVPEYVTDSLVRAEENLKAVKDYLERLDLAMLDSAGESDGR